jgi:hypothetical protein
MTIITEYDLATPFCSVVYGVIVELWPINDNMPWVTDA